MPISDLLPTRSTPFSNVYAMLRLPLIARLQRDRELNVPTDRKCTCSVQNCERTPSWLNRLNPLIYSHSPCSKVPDCTLLTFQYHFENFVIKYIWFLNPPHSAGFHISGTDFSFGLLNGLQSASMQVITLYTHFRIELYRSKVWCARMLAASLFPSSCPSFMGQSPLFL